MLVPNVSFDAYKLNFLERFIESHLVMFSTNANLKPKDGERTSRPWMWPINLKVIFNKHLLHWYIIIIIMNEKKNRTIKFSFLIFNLLMQSELLRQYFFDFFRANFFVPLLNTRRFTCWVIRSSGGEIWFSWPYTLELWLWKPYKVKEESSHPPDNLV